MDTPPRKPRPGPGRQPGTGIARARSSVAAAARPARRGAVLLVAVVCVGVCCAIFVSLVRLSVAERHRADAEAWQVQAAWLAESGLERAVARLRADAGYQGETWNLTADAMGTGEPAVVTIQVEKVPEGANRRLVRVRADYPDDPQHRARSSKQAAVELSGSP
jgi:hypothetical protein